MGVHVAVRAWALACETRMVDDDGGPAVHLWHAVCLTACLEELVRIV